MVVLGHLLQAKNIRMYMPLVQWYVIGTMVKRDSWVDENGRAQSILGVIDHYESFSGCYLIKYNNGQGWELILEDDITKVLWFVM